jgi:hypothetical protein
VVGSPFHVGVFSSEAAAKAGLVSWFNEGLSASKRQPDFDGVVEFLGCPVDLFGPVTIDGALVEPLRVVRTNGAEETSDG